MNRANHLFVFSFSLLKQIWCQQMNSRLCFWKKSEKKSQNTISGSWSLKDSRCGNRIKRLESASSGRVTSSTGDLPWYSHSPPWTENRFRRTIEDTRLHTVWATALSGLYHPWRSNNTSRYCNWGESNTDKPRPWAVWVSIVSRFQGVLASLGILHATWVQFPWLR